MSDAGEAQFIPLTISIVQSSLDSYIFYLPVSTITVVHQDNSFNAELDTSASFGTLPISIEVAPGAAMMGDMHHMHRGIMSLEAPLCEVDTGDHSFRESWNAPYSYPQIPSHSIGVPCMSWSATDPAVLSIEQNSVKPPFSWQAESCLQQYTHGGYSAMGSPMEMIAALNADSYNPNELSQMVQLYNSLYQDQYGYPNLSFMDPTADLLLPTSSECLQVVSLSSGSDSLSTTETWSSGGCAPNYDQVLMNESSSVTLVGESNFLPQRPQLDVLKLDQAVPVPPVQDSWIHNQLHADITGRSSNLHTVSMTSYDVLPVSSSSGPTFKRPRTWDEALQQGSSAGSDPVRYSLTSKTSLKFDCSLNPLSRAISSRELRTSTRQTPFQGTLPASHPIGSAYPRRLDLQEEGSRFFVNGKPAATSVEPQSVAARHRRKKISERIRVLEKLIPGGNKMDTATMLDEAIEYVKFLQLQVQILESDSLDGIPVAASTQSLNSTADKQGSKRKFDTATGGDFSAGSLRAAASPLILSEVLQQQLFKQKLCLVSIRECSSRPPSTTQTAGACAAPSILRKK